MAIMASKGVVSVADWEAVGMEVRSVVLEPPRRSPAEREEVVDCWTWEAEKSLVW